ncbi:MAG: aminopeptidase [Spirochaetales bacterium]|uniref:Aminopeptidase n=1 Tax=Candidatus Thalassospirochaeta sargassi TaxID=3119039 RepID=A0AAJ1IEF3_9SPIO|nr:aminopeptidase [Spirochaetales bacterium]
MDKRWKKLGEILVNYSTRVQRGEKVMIAMIEPETWPLAHAVYEAVVKAGGYPQIQLKSETLRRCFLEYGTAEQISWVPEIEMYGMEWADVYIGLRGAHNLFELQDIPADKLASNQNAMGVVSTARWEKTRWCLIRVPNESFAQQAETSYESLLDMFFNSCFIDWKTELPKWEKWCRRLENSRNVRITGKNTDLSFSIEGRKWMSFAGTNNFPDGEIATAPITSTINGTIWFENPGVLGGRLMNDLRLTWKDGVLTEASSSTEQEFLTSIVSKDAGSSLIGEFAIGTNFSIDRFCNDILLDEKIGGTIHIALGRAYPECGGLNKSAIHWDIVKDIRREGAVYVDDKVIVEGGKIYL